MTIPSDGRPTPPPPVVLAQRVRFDRRLLVPSRWLWLVAAVSLLVTVPIVVRTGQPVWILFTVGFTLFFYVGMTWTGLRRTDGQAWADPAGVHWSGRYGSYSYAWPQIDWIELAFDQPGARLFNRWSPESTTRTGRRVGIALVVDAVPHYVHPVWTAADGNRIAFGCALAAYAHAQGVRVRVLQGDWGAENVNREPTRL